MTKILVAGLDGSLRNFGVARIWVDTDTLELDVMDFTLIQTEKGKGKQVRASSDNLRRAQELVNGLREATKGCTSAFAEVPSGGQDYNAVLGFGITIGVYAGLTVPLIEVSPGETKTAAVGSKNAAKHEMIDWAVERFPTAPWRRQTRNGATWKIGDLKNDNEHLADGCGVVCAGIKVPAFQQTLAILRAHHQMAA